MDTVPVMFKTDEPSKLRTYHEAVGYTFDRCEFGLDHVKKTRLLSDTIMDDLVKTCFHGSGYHKDLNGMDLETGRWCATDQSSYPPLFNEALTRGYLRHRQGLERQ